MCNRLSFKMDQDSIVLDGIRPNSTAKLFGTIQIHCTSACFIPPVWAKIQLVGKEEIGNASRIFMNDTYQLSNCSSDWNFSSQTSKSTSANITASETVYDLPVSFTIPSSIPTSFQLINTEEDFGFCEISYTLEIRVSSINEGAIYPIYFRKSNTKNSQQFETQAISKSVKESNDDEVKETIPKRVFWGITRKSMQRWQYELEFPSMYDLITSKSEPISVRLRSVCGNRTEMSGDCCLIGCQIRQSIHLEGFESLVQVLATTTKLVTCPNKSWSKPCQLQFDFEDSPILQSMYNERLGVEHSIRITIEFSNAAGVSNTSANLDLQFPVVFTGCISNNKQRAVSVEMKTFASAVVSSGRRSHSSSMSSFTIEDYSSHDSGIDIPPICKLRNA